MPSASADSDREPQQNELSPEDVAREAAFERKRHEHERRYLHYLRTGVATDHDKVAAWLDSIGTNNPLPPPHRQQLATPAT